MSWLRFKLLHFPEYEVGNSGSKVIDVGGDNVRNEDIRTDDHW
jgi:hypothetical protein